MSDALKAELVTLEAMTDDAIDTSDIPPVKDWSGAKRGVLYRPIKQQLSALLDADVVHGSRKRATMAAKAKRRG